MKSKRVVAAAVVVPPSAVGGGSFLRSPNTDLVRRRLRTRPTKVWTLHSVPAKPRDTARAMSPENVELARQAYGAYNREGINGILEYLDPAVEWRNPIESPNAGVFVGFEGVLEWQRMVDEAYEEMHFEPERIEELPDGRILAVLRFRLRARASGLTTEVPFAHLITMRDGKATALSMYTSEAEALKAAGLREQRDTAQAMSHENVEIVKRNSVEQGLRGTRADEGSAAVGAAENAEAVRRGYDAFNSADMETLTELFDERAVWHVPGRSSLAGDHEGREAVFAYFGRLGQETGGTFRAELQHLLADGDRVVGIHHNSAERDGKRMGKGHRGQQRRLDVDVCLVFRLEDGRITKGVEHYRDLYAWDEFWS